MIKRFAARSKLDGRIFLFEENPCDGQSKPVQGITIYEPSVVLVMHPSNLVLLDVSRNSANNWMKVKGIRIGDEVKIIDNLNIYAQHLQCGPFGTILPKESTFIVQSTVDGMICGKKGSWVPYFFCEQIPQKSKELEVTLKYTTIANYLLWDILKRFGNSSGGPLYSFVWDKLKCTKSKFANCIAGNVFVFYDSKSNHVYFSNSSKKGYIPNIPCVRVDNFFQLSIPEGKPKYTKVSTDTSGSTYQEYVKSLLDGIEPLPMPKTSESIDLLSEPKVHKVKPFEL